MVTSKQELLTRRQRALGKVARQYLDSPFAGLAIPERRLSGLYRPAQLTKSVVDNVLFADPGKDVRPVSKGDWPFRILPQRHAGDAQHGGLFLEPSRIRQDEFGLGEQAEEIHITKGSKGMNARRLRPGV